MYEPKATGQRPDARGHSQREASEGARPQPLRAKEKQDQGFQGFDEELYVMNDICDDSVDLSRPWSILVLAMI